MDAYGCTCHYESIAGVDLKVERCSYCLIHVNRSAACSCVEIYGKPTIFDFDTSELSVVIISDLPTGEADLKCESIGAEPQIFKNRSGIVQYDSPISNEGVAVDGVGKEEDNVSASENSKYSKESDFWRPRFPRELPEKEDEVPDPDQEDEEIKDRTKFIHFFEKDYIQRNKKLNSGLLGTENANQKKEKVPQELFSYKDTPFPEIDLQKEQAKQEIKKAEQKKPDAILKKDTTGAKKYGTMELFLMYILGMLSALIIVCVTKKSN